jgi:hypothetical protein
MIYIREKDEVLSNEMGLMKDLVIQLLTVCPRTMIYKEFFTFFREIFYYNKDMD